MVEVAMQKMAADHPDLSFVLAPGDLVGHAISLNIEKSLTEKEIKTSYDQLMQVHR